LSNIEIVTKAIGKENIENHIIPTLLELTTDKQWRVKYAIVQFFTEFAETFEHDLYLEKLEQISRLPCRQRLQH
jgi:hypothetical protein